MKEERMCCSRGVAVLKKEIKKFRSVKRHGYGLSRKCQHKYDIETEGRVDTINEKRKIKKSK